jgi:hypothetical protein
MLDKGADGSNSKKLGNEVTFINEAKRATSCKETGVFCSKYNGDRDKEISVSHEAIERFMLGGAEEMIIDTVAINDAPE